MRCAGRSARRQRPLRSLLIFRQARSSRAVSLTGRRRRGLAIVRAAPARLAVSRVGVGPATRRRRQLCGMGRGSTRGLLATPAPAASLQERPSAALRRLESSSCQTGMAAVPSGAMAALACCQMLLSRQLSRNSCPAQVSDLTYAP